MSNSKQQRRRGRALVLWLLLVGVMLVACELMLQLAAAVSPRIAYLFTPVYQRERVNDERLGFRLSPYYPGHDRLGYRNPDVPDSVDILTIGDSFTYGYAALAESSYPRQLEKLTGRSVYNGGVPNYGPCEYRLVLQDLLRLEPKVVILGIHTGNDLGDAYISVYEQNRCPEFRSADSAVVAQLRRLDRDSTLMQLAVARGWENGGQVEAPLGLVRMRIWIANHSALYAMLREFRRQIESGKEQERDRFTDDSARPGRVVHAGAQPPRTVFKNPAMFMLAVNLEDARIREGMRLTERIILDMQRQLQAQNVDFRVLLIMDKPSMYAPLLAEQKAPVPPEFFTLATLETNVAAELTRFLTANSIPVANATPALQDSLRHGVAVYPDWDDHHNNAKGYGVIASLAAGLLPTRLTHAANAH
jgi:hypothetical protein